MNRGMGSNLQTTPALAEGITISRATWKTPQAAVRVVADTQNVALGLSLCPQYRQAQITGGTNARPSNAPREGEGQEKMHSAAAKSRACGGEMPRGQRCKGRNPITSARKPLIKSMVWRRRVWNRIERSTKPTCCLYGTPSEPLARQGMQGQLGCA
eukprot:CAMPEP_0174312956 /NCGR_PEP_ID=MMETSP0810-20121108/4651_1 /TAXON_ID=73025 ORGANISM="Eutreptiella gymnastica-like, Strain CCMP1594" /NCGR_SAMPLE_ID=MMETSP0810 /ASSEMBLY_ACC=CAM_ASM_000659 /LENGTH=155 /DNA_ID=CAMNT_0015421553 /DNA_START=490 /DNA_END=958 /DNA_ORIENTATION=-